VVLKVRLTRIAVALCAIAATAAVSVVPAAHVHWSTAGVPAVHRHVVANADDDHGATVNHGDHRRVRTVAPSFVSERNFGMAPPLAAAALMLPPPVALVAGRVASRDVPLAHSPPLRFTSLRAPPA
jgi:hypothetical protein